jgi:tetratricopeptide (TPR) repeat protein
MENRPFKPMHIFQTILDLHKEKIVIDDKLDMLNLYYTIETFLQNCRTNNMHFSNYLYDKVILSYNQLSDELKNSMNVIYYPAIAYYYYKKQDYNNAINNLNNSIAFIEKLENLDVNFVFAKIEQTINKYKVNVKINNRIEANKIGLSISDFLLTGNPSEYITKSVLHSSIPKKEKDDYYAHFVSIFENDFKTTN